MKTKPRKTNRDESICFMCGHRVPLEPPRYPDEYTRCPRCNAQLRLQAG